MPKMPPKSNQPYKEDRSLWPSYTGEARARKAAVPKDAKSQAAFRKVLHEHMECMYVANKAVFAAERAKQDAEIAAGTRPPRVVRVMQSPSPTEQGKGKGKAERREVAEAKAKKEAQDKERENRFVRRDDKRIERTMRALGSFDVNPE
jgi:hypothetical protein